MLYFLSFCLLFNEIANAQFRSEGDERDPLQALDVPFVPEDFRSSPKRIIFDKNDYVKLLPSEDLEKPLTDAIVTLLQETQARANDSKVRLRPGARVTVPVTKLRFFTSDLSRH